MKRAIIATAAAVLCAGAARAGLTTVGDWDFADNLTPAGFTTVGNPTYAEGQLVVDGNDAIDLATTPLWVADNFVVEAIVTANAFGDDDFVSNGGGLLAIQLTAAAGNRWRSKVAGHDFIGRVPGTTNTKVAVAFVSSLGVAKLYVNGVPDWTDIGYVPGLPASTRLTIGARDGGIDFFKGSIDRVRLSTITGAFDPADLLTKDDGTVSTDTPGDFDADGDVDADDIDLLCDNLGNAAYDLDGDSDADEDDMTFLVEHLVELTDGVRVGTKRGDFNLDGLVNGTDLANMKSNFGLAGMGYANGNINCDDVINGTDLAAMKPNFGYAAPPASAVPEPATLGLLAMGGLVPILSGLRRKK